MSVLNLIPFAISTWLGLFLLARGKHPRLRLTAIGLFFYAAALITSGSLSNVMRLFPPVFWVGAILYLDQRVTDKHSVLEKAWQLILIPVTLLISGFFLFTPSLFSSSFFSWTFFLIGLAPLFWMFSLIRDFITLLRPRQATGVLVVATFFFALGEGFLFLPLHQSLQQYVLPAIGFDLLLLGFCMAWFDALDEGETFLPEMLRSFILTTVIVIIFAGQVGFVIVIQTGFTEGMKILLTTTITACIFLSIFGNQIQNKLDALVVSHSPALQEARKRLQVESTVLSRKNLDIDLSKLNEEERTRLTRRALSHFGDLIRLASNPLTQLPVIERGLKARNVADSTLDRAAELKSLLVNSIMKLKPQNEKLFDTTDEWRFYNSVFFPYVAGLRPYSRTQERDLQPYEKEAMEWFQTSVPERTLHNWQNAAAKLIANDLWESNY